MMMGVCAGGLSLVHSGICNEEVPYIYIYIYIYIIIHALWLNEKSWYNLPFVLLTFLALFKFLNSKRSIVCCCCCCQEESFYVGFVAESLIMQILVSDGCLIFTFFDNRCWFPKKKQCQNQIIFGFLFFKKNIIIFFYKFIIYPSMNWWIYIAFLK